MERPVVAASMTALIYFGPSSCNCQNSVRSAAGEFVHLTGNRIGVLLADYIIRKRKAAGTLGPQHFVVETLVTTPLIAEIARSYKLRAVDNSLVAFKYIAQTMDRKEEIEAWQAADQTARPWIWL